jgi:hypothetical protein
MLFGEEGPAHCSQHRAGIPRSIDFAGEKAQQMAMDMPAAIRPYSMAVAPDSSLRKALSV